MRKALQAAAMLFGLVAAALSLLGAMIPLLFLALGDEASLLSGAALSLSILALGCGLGLSLAWASWRSLQERPSPSLGLPSAWLLILLFVLLLIAGEILRRSAAAPLMLPPIHVVASLLPPLVVIAWVAHPLQRAGVRLTRRDLVSQLAYGSLAAALLAVVLEMIALLGIGLMAGTLVVLLPAGQGSLQQLSRNLQSPATLGDSQALLPLLRSPALLLAVGLVVALLAPLIEEAVKSLGVGLTGLARQRLGKGQAFALGVMAGAGFSLTEAIFNGLVMLPDAWAGVVLIRSATTVVHGLATGLAGLAIYALLVGRRPWQFIGTMAGAVALHGVWNALGGLAALAGLDFLQGVDSGPVLLSTTLALLSSGLLLVLFLACAAALILIPYRLAAEAPQAARHVPAESPAA